MYALASSWYMVSQFLTLNYIGATAYEELQKENGRKLQAMNGLQTDNSNPFSSGSSNSMLANTTVGNPASGVGIGSNPGGFLGSNSVAALP